jgi:hypothetical protein
MIVVSLQLRVAAESGAGLFPLALCAPEKVYVRFIQSGWCVMLCLLSLLFYLTIT